MSKKIKQGIPFFKKSLDIFFHGYYNKTNKICRKPYKNLLSGKVSLSCRAALGRGGISMNHCTNCGADFEGKICPHCGKAATKTATESALRAKHALRLLHSLLLIAFGVLVIGLMAASAYGMFATEKTETTSITMQLGSMTFFDILTVGGVDEGALYGCSIFLLIFAILAVVYGIILALTNKSYADLKYTTLLFIYLPIFIIMCAFTSHSNVTYPVAEGSASKMFTQLTAGGICIFLFTVVFAAGQIVALAMEARVEKKYIFEDKEAAVAAELGTPDAVPYPEIPQIDDFSKESQEDYYATRNNYYDQVNLHKANRKEWRAFRKTFVSTLYQRKFGKTAAYPLAYLWWNFSA